MVDVEGDEEELGGGAAQATTTRHEVRRNDVYTMLARLCALYESPGAAAAAAHRPAWRSRILEELSGLGLGPS